MTNINDLEGHEKAKALWHFAHSDLMNRDYEAAIAGFRESLAIEEGVNTRVFLVLSMFCLKSDENNEETIKEASLAIAKGFKNPEFFYFIGSAKNRLNQREEAKPYLEQFIALAGKDKVYKRDVKDAKRQLKWSWWNA